MSTRHNIGRTKRRAYLHARGREGSQLLLHTVSDTREHGGTAREDDVAVEVATDIEIALVDRVVPVMGKKANSVRLQVVMGNRRTHVVSWTPAASSPRKAGWKSASGARNLSENASIAVHHDCIIRSTMATDRSLPMVITCPSGSS